MKQAHRSYKSSFAAIKIENRSTLAYVSLSSPFSKGKRNAADRIDWIPEVLLLFDIHSYWVYVRKNEPIISSKRKKWESTWHPSLRILDLEIVVHYSSPEVHSSKSLIRQEGLMS